MNLDPFPCGEGNLVDEVIEELKARIKELEQDLENMTLEKDIEYDRAEKLYERMEDLKQGEPQEEDDEYRVVDKDRLEQFEKDEELLEEVKDRISNLNTAYSRLQLGVLTDIDEIIKLTDELLEMDL